MARDKREFTLELKLSEADIRRGLKGIGGDAEKAFRGVERGSRRAEGRMARFTRRAKKDFDGLIMSAKRLGRSLAVGLVGLGTLGLGAVIGGGFAAEAIGRQAVDDASAYQIALAEVETILPGLSEGTGHLADEVTRLAIAHGQNETVVSRGLYQVISAGITDSADALMVLEQATILGIVGLSDTATAVDILTTVLNAYRLEVAEAERVSDVLFTTVRKGKTTIGELAGSIGPVLPLAASLGVEIEDVGGALATLTGIGFSTSDSTTLLKALFKSLTTQVRDVDKVFQRLGLRYDETTIRQLGLAETLDVLRKGLINDAESMEIMGGRLEATNALLGLTGKNLGTFKDNLDATADAAGAASKAYSIITEKDAKQLELAANAVRISFRALGDAILASAANALDEFGGVEKVTVAIGLAVDQLREPIRTLFVGIGRAAGEWLQFLEDTELATAKADRIVSKLALFAQSVDALVSSITTGLAAALDVVVAGVDILFTNLQRFLRTLPGEIGDAFRSEREILIQAKLDVLEPELQRLLNISEGRFEDGSSIDMLLPVADMQQAAREAGELADEIVFWKESLEDANAAYSSLLDGKDTAAIESLFASLDDRAKSLGDEWGQVTDLMAEVAALDKEIARLEDTAGDRAEARRREVEARRAEIEAMVAAELAAAAAGRDRGPPPTGDVQDVRRIEDILAFEKLMADLASQSAETDREKIDAQRTLLDIQVRRLRTEGDQLALNEEEAASLEAAIDRFQEVADRAIDAGPVERAAQMQAELRKEITGLTDDIDAQRAEIEAWAVQERTRIELLLQDKLITAESADEILALVDALKLLREEQLAAGDSTALMDSEFAAVESSYDSFLRSAISGSKSFGDAVKDMVAQILIDLAVLELKAATLNLFGGDDGGAGLLSLALTTLASSGGEGTDGGGGGGGAEGLAKGASLPKGIRFLQSGSVINKPSLAVVGEGTKPEGVFPLARMPNGDLGLQSSGGGGDAFNFTIQAIDTKNGIQFLLDNQRTIAGMVSRAVRHNRSTTESVRVAAGGRGRGF